MSFTISKKKFAAIIDIHNVVNDEIFFKCTIYPFATIKRTVEVKR